MIITNAKYHKLPDVIIDGKTKSFPNSSIICEIDGEYWGVPIDEQNTHYIEIKRQLNAGLITIEAAE